MKRSIPMMVLIFFATIGILFLIFVIRMIWFTPGPMGMMMGRQMMFHHMSDWITQTFWLSVFIAGTGMLIWLIITRKNEKQ